jgi:hypothetical protein
MELEACPMRQGGQQGGPVIGDRAFALGKREVERRDATQVAPRGPPRLGLRFAAHQAPQAAIVEVDDPGPIAAANRHPVGEGQRRAMVAVTLQRQDRIGADRPDSPQCAVDPLDEAKDRVEEGWSHRFPSARHEAILGTRAAPRKGARRQPRWYGTSTTTVLRRKKSRSFSRSAVWLWSGYSQKWLGTNSGSTTVVGWSASARSVASR